MRFVFRSSGNVGFQGQSQVGRMGRQERLISGGREEAIHREGRGTDQVTRNEVKKKTWFRLFTCT